MTDQKYHNWLDREFYSCFKTINNVSLTRQKLTFFFFKKKVSLLLKKFLNLCCKHNELQDMLSSLVSC